MLSFPASDPPAVFLEETQQSHGRRIKTAGVPDQKHGSSEPRLTRKELRTIRRISAADAHHLVEAGDAVLADTRSRQFYQEAHAAGAISIPFGEIRRSADHPALGSVPKGKTIVLYCT